MKTKIQGKRKGKKNEKLEKFMASVNDYVQSKGGCDETDHEQRFIFVKKKSRKELRKQKRKMKKAKMNSHYTGKQHPSESPIPGAVNEKVSSAKQQHDEKVQEKNKKHAQAKSLIDAENTKVDTNQKSKAQVDSKEAMSEQRKNLVTKVQETRKQALLEANIAEDREIKKLEKCLGLNKRKNKQSLPQSFAEDGLDYILGILEPGASGSALYDSDEEDMDIAKAKDNFENLGEDSDSEMSGDEEEPGDRGEDKESDRQDGDSHERELDDIAEEDEDQEEEDDDEMEEEEDGMEDEDSAEASEEESEVDGGEEIAPEDEEIPEDKDRSMTVVRYVPPHLRDAADGKRKAELERLKRSVKGLVNRLSEPNMASISGQLEQLYMSSSRKDMNDTLTELVMAACVMPTLMPDRLLMEHILLVSVLHHTVGLEVGAHFLEAVVRRFDELYQRPPSEEGKQCANLLAMVAHLYNFHVVHSLLVFDLLRKLLAGFSERDIELLLLVLKNVGFALRKDDALALKELISEAQRTASAVGAKFQDQTRVRFMLETMLALKNNDMRKIPGYDPEPVERLRKLHRTLIHRSASGSDVKLRVSLENLLGAEQVGRWWIVGSCWSGRPMIGDHGNKTTPKPTAEGQFSAKVLELARKQRMNTDIRKNIFCVLMTSEDYLDAFEKLLRLGLKDQQEREIVHVLMDCCLQEKSFNAYYAVLGEKFCSHDRRFQMTFQFSLWDKFRDMATLSGSTFTNLALLVTHFLHRKCLSLSILKAIEFGELDKPKVKFLRQVLTRLLKDTEPEELASIFGRISGVPKLGMLREGLKLFISHFLLRNATSLGTAEQAEQLTERAGVATKAMEARDAKLKL